MIGTFDDARAQLAAHVAAVHVGQPEVQQHDVDVLARPRRPAPPRRWRRGRRRSRRRSGRRSTRPRRHDRPRPPGPSWAASSQRTAGGHRSPWTNLRRPRHVPVTTRSYGRRPDEAAVDHLGAHRGRRADGRERGGPRQHARARQREGQAVSANRVQLDEAQTWDAPPMASPQLATTVPAAEPLPTTTATTTTPPWRRRSPPAGDVDAPSRCHRPRRHRSGDEPIAGSGARRPRCDDGDGRDRTAGDDAERRRAGDWDTSAPVPDRRPRPRPSTLGPDADVSGRGRARRRRRPRRRRRRARARRRRRRHRTPTAPPDD